MPATLQKQRLMRHRGALALIALAIAMTTSRAHTTAHPPELAGRTSITSNGSNGIRFRVPKEAEADWRKTTLTLREGTMAFVGMGSPPLNGICPDTGVRWACITLWGGSVPASGFSFVLGGSSPALVEEGYVDVYILTDGVAEFTLVVEGLDGAMQAEATGTISGHIEHLPKRCLDDCSRLGFGGATHATNGPSFAEVFVFAGAGPGAVFGNLSTGAVEPCMYPWPGLDVSTDPEDHPHGCNWVWDARDHREASLYASSHSRYVTSAGHSRVAYWQFTHAASGPVYLGYRATAVPVNGQAGYGAVGVWLDMGISA